MRVLITGGAGFIGSHLAEAYLARGDEVFVLDDLSTGSIDNIRHLKANDRFHYAIESVHHAPTVAELVNPCDVRDPSRRGGRGPPDRREPGPDHRDQRARDRGRPGPGEQEEEEGPDRLDLGGLRPERAGPLPRGGEPGPGSDLQGAMELRLLEGDRRVPRAGVLARAPAPHGHRAAVQHGRPAADRAIRHGRATFVKQALTGRPITIHGDGSQSRCFCHVGDVVRALDGADGPSRGRSARSSTSAPTRR